jgi:hypothetical protein
VLPNAAAPLIAEFGLRFCFVFLFISALSFLGLGIQPPTADWGSMVRDNAVLITFGDISPLLPALAVALITVSVNFVVDWMLHNPAASRNAEHDDLQTLLEIRNLHIEGHYEDAWHPLIKGIDLTLQRGEVLGLIGESGQASRPSACRPWAIPETAAKSPAARCISTASTCSRPSPKPCASCGACASPTSRRARPLRSTRPIG